MLRPPPSFETVVIIGAGLTGLRVAEGARGAGYTGRIILVGDERHLPYDRPPLSKSVLLSDDYVQALPLLSIDQLDRLKIKLELGRRATFIDRDAHNIELCGGDRIVYDRLVIATGSSARELPGLEAGRKGIYYLRNLDDGLALRGALESAQRVLIIGAGVIGMEVAAAAAQRGAAVTVVEAGDRVMSRAAAPVISDYIAREHTRKGVDVRVGAVVSDVHDAAEDGMIAKLSDGALIRCDMIVVGVGITPNDVLARTCGLDVAHGGIIVDGYGKTSDPAIYAAGEVALHFNARYGTHDRQETWAHASVHGEHVGRSMVEETSHYDALSSYWSDQYDFSLNVVGRPIGSTNVVRGDLVAGKFVVLHLLDGRIIGASAINAARELRWARSLIGLSETFDPAVLSDPRIDLRSLIPKERSKYHDSTL